MNLEAKEAQLVCCASLANDDNSQRFKTSRPFAQCPFVESSLLVDTSPSLGNSGRKQN